MSTESRNPRSIALDQMSPVEIARLMNSEEATVLRSLAESEHAIVKAAEKVAASYQAGGRTIYVGSGTSGRVAMMDAAEMPPTFGVQPHRFQAVVSGGRVAQDKAHEAAEDDTAAGIHAINELGLTKKDVVIGITASGRTPFVLSAVRHARQKGIWTCGIVNNPRTPMEDVANTTIVLDTGPEVLTGSTRLKAGTAQKLALNRISTIAMVLSGKVIENLMVDVKPSNNKLKERCTRIVRDLTTATEDEARQRLEDNGWKVREAIDYFRAHPHIHSTHH